MSKMFTFIDGTWNPEGGECKHRCPYCWAQGEKGLREKYQMDKYHGPPVLVEKELKRKFNDKFIFVCDMCDLFGNWIPSSHIFRILECITGNQNSAFLLLTKNPKRYREYVFAFPRNVVLGATIESNRDYTESGKAPSQTERLAEMYWLSKYDYPLFIAIEPIYDFDLEDFVRWIEMIDPVAVAVGYDNYNNGLPEPSLDKTMNLIRELEKFTIVYRKTLR